jgi:formylglycine-generating enzyme required for sulfatase activity
MRWKQAAWFGGGSVLLAAIAAVGLLPAEAEDPPASAQVAALIQQLGDDQYARREAAAKELEELGDVALPALRQATSSADLEIRLRARELVAAIALQLRTSKSIGLQMVSIEPAAFQMGSAEAETGRQANELRHEVRITTPFYLGVYEVTQEEYKRVLRRNPSQFTTAGMGNVQLEEKDIPRLPVEGVCWYDAIQFCNELSKLDGFEPYYELTDIKRSETVIVSARVTVAGGKGYRLPTEAEWEFACRGGDPGPFHFGFEPTGAEANIKPGMTAGGYGGASPKWREVGRPMRVGSYLPNTRGLHDMHGNVAEWCWDWYDKDYYARSPKEDPSGPATGTQRVLRSGSWMVLEASCRSASRFYHTPDERKNYVGFRVARNP